MTFPLFSLLLPQFVKDVMGDSGFDKTATPPFLVVSTAFPNFIFIDNAQKADVRIRPAAIASLRELPNIGGIPRREFEITGNLDGAAFVEVFVPGGTVALARMEVRVKDPLPLVPISFQRVTDITGNATGRAMSNIGNDVFNELNTIFGPQTQLRFDQLRDIDVTANTSYKKIIDEQKRNTSMNPFPELAALTSQGDPTARINVFFMLGSKQSQEVFSDDFGNIICNDALSDDEIKTAVPHLIGRLLKCKPVSSDQLANYVMHIDRSEGKRAGNNSGNFIPKACVQTIWNTLGRP